MTDELFSAYRQTTYSAATPLGKVCLRVGEPCDLLLQLLDLYRVADWAYLTADNPGSRLVAAAENQAQCQALEESLQSEGLVYFRGAAVGDDHAWPPEQSFLVLGISRSRAIEFAKRFRQNAILAGGSNSIPQLIDCR